MEGVGMNAAGTIEYLLTAPARFLYGQPHPYFTMLLTPQADVEASVFWRN
jgi:hypothetical protein